MSPLLMSSLHLSVLLPELWGVILRNDPLTRRMVAMVSRDDQRRLPPPGPPDMIATVPAFPSTRPNTERIIYPAITGAHVDLVIWWARTCPDRHLESLTRVVYDYALQQGQVALAHILVGLMSIPPSGRAFVRRRIVEFPCDYPHASISDTLIQPPSSADLHRFANWAQSDALFQLLPHCTTNTRVSFLCEIIRYHQWAMIDRMWYTFPEDQTRVLLDLEQNSHLTDLVQARYHTPGLAFAPDSLPARISTSVESKLAAKKLARRTRDNERRREMRKRKREEQERAAREIAMQAMQEARAKEEAQAVRHFAELLDRDIPGQT